MNIRVYGQINEINEDVPLAVSTVSAPCDAHDVRGKPQSTNMVAKIKKGKKFK